MPEVWVNKDLQPNGDHEVHRKGWDYCLVQATGWLQWTWQAPRQQRP